jgi:hypothetical protein
MCWLGSLLGHDTANLTLPDLRSPGGKIKWIFEERIALNPIDDRTCENYMIRRRQIADAHPPLRVVKQFAMPLVHGHFRYGNC